MSDDDVRVEYVAQDGQRVVMIAPFGLITPPTIELHMPFVGPKVFIYQGLIPESQDAPKCICTRFSDTGGFRIADLACPIHGVNGTDPGDGYE